MCINYFGIGLNAHMMNNSVAGPEEKKIDKLLLLKNQSKINVEEQDRVVAKLKCVGSTG